MKTSESPKFDKRHGNSQTVSSTLSVAHSILLLLRVQLRPGCKRWGDTRHPSRSLPAELPTQIQIPEPALTLFVTREDDSMLRARSCCANCATVLMASESYSGVCSSQSSNCMLQSITSTQSFTRRFSSCRATSTLNRTCSAYRTVIHLRRSKSARESAYHPTRQRTSLSESAELLRRSIKVGSRDCDIQLFHLGNNLH